MKLFVAYPWEMSIKNMYDNILGTLAEQWDINHGSDITKVNNIEAEIEMFRQRNKQLYDIFVSRIDKSEVFIADVTNGNANVMLELGIAIQLNKNILIVTSQNQKELPFDIKGFKANHYRSKKGLLKIIKHHLELFLNIKNQNFESYYPESYFCINKGQLLHGQTNRIRLPDRIKNFKLRVEYRFVNVSDPIDWFGIHLRAQAAMPIISSSELIYVRSNTHLESVTFPGRRVPTEGEDKNRQINSHTHDFQILELTIEENQLSASTSNKELTDNEIQLESFGDLILQAWAHDTSNYGKLLVEYRKLEIINLDTISPTH